MASFLTNWYSSKEKASFSLHVVSISYVSSRELSFGGTSVKMCHVVFEYELIIQLFIILFSLLSGYLICFNFYT